MAATAFSILFAVAVFAMFVLGARKQWLRARIAVTVVAVLAFLLALLTAKVK